MSNNSKAANQAKAKYNSKAYRTLTTKLKPDLYKELYTVKDKLGYSLPELLEYMLHIYTKYESEASSLQSTSYLQEKNERAKALVEELAAQFNKGVWVRIRFPDTPNTLSDRYQNEACTLAAKLIAIDGEFTLATIRDGLPRFYHYKQRQISLTVYDGSPALCIDGNPEYYDFYEDDEDNPYDSKEDYLDTHLRRGPVGLDELKEFSKEIVKNALPEISLVETRYELDGPSTAEEHLAACPDNELLRNILSGDPVWVMLTNEFSAMVFSKDPAQHPYTTYPARLQLTNDILYISNFYGYPHFDPAPERAYNCQGYRLQELSFSEGPLGLKLHRKVRPSYVYAFEKTRHTNFNDFLNEFFETAMTSKDELDALDLVDLPRVFS